MAREDVEAAAVVRQALEEDGVDVRLEADIQRINPADDASDHSGAITVVLADETLAVDELLVAAGRRPNVEGLGLEAAGVDYDERTGIEVDDRLQITASHVYAVGDVASRYQFTHAADFMARIVVRNSLFSGARVSKTC